MQDYGKESVALSEKLHRYLSGISSLTAGDVNQYPLLILQGKMLLGELSVLKERIREGVQRQPDAAMSAAQIEAGLQIQEEQLQGVVEVLENADRTRTEADRQQMEFLIRRAKEKFTNG